MRILKSCATLFAIAMLAGCAHSIIISPNVSKIQPADGDHQSNQNVGYYIAEDARAKEVVTPGGGGDKVSYQPYRDIETGFYKMLSNLYSSVTKLKSPNDPAISSGHLSYVITPTITTKSSSPSPFTWPPTQFSVDLTCKISDSNGNVVATKSVTGNGNAEFNEFKHDYGLSAQRATEDALLKMQHELSGLGVMHQDGTPMTSEANTSAAKVSTESINQPVTTPPLVVKNEMPATEPAPAAPATSVAPAAPEPAPAPAVQAVQVEQHNAVTSIPQEQPQAPPPAPALMTATTSQPVAETPFQLGVSSVTVEKMARQSGCESKEGAGLITASGPVEKYQMICQNGSIYLAQCEFRQCKQVLQ